MRPSQLEERCFCWPLCSWEQILEKPRCRRGTGSARRKHGSRSSTRPAGPLPITKNRRDSRRRILAPGPVRNLCQAGPALQVEIPEENPGLPDRPRGAQARRAVPHWAEGEHCSEAAGHQIWRSGSRSLRTQPPAIVVSARVRVGFRMRGREGMRSSAEIRQIGCLAG